MTKSWNEIEQFYSELHSRLADISANDPFLAAVAGVNRLVTHIANGPFARFLFGWTSMHDLCVQQVEVEPYSGPFLSISPKIDGTLEFRYHDTAIEARQWSRSVPPTGVIGRFDAFLEQLHWMAH